jgi:hypothetical protein
LDADFFRREIRKRMDLMPEFEKKEGLNIMCVMVNVEL